MLIQIILFVFLGILTGIFTGLIPGIHINLIGALLISSSFLFFLNPLYLAVFISALAITHTFIDFIPSILLGCPDTDTELSVLPGHELLKKGKGYEAIILTSYGSLASIFILIFISAPCIYLISNFYSEIENLIPYLLIIISLFMIFSEKNRFNAFVVFSLTGIFGLIVLNLQNLEQPLLPLLTGLFGSSMLVLSIQSKPKLIKQDIIKPKEKIIKPILGALVASPLCSFLPGMGSGQAAIIGNTLIKTNQKGFLILLGATNTLVMGFSFISLYVISKTRTGAALAIKQILGNFDLNLLILIISVVLISGIISFFITKKLAKIFSQKITSFNYSKISLIVLIFLSIVVFLVSGFLGLFVLLVATLTGIYCIKLNVRKTNMMGCLLLNTILFYLGFV